MTKVLVFPRDGNPYQEELYGSMAATRPLEVRYVDGPTGSQTLNVLLLPAMLLAARCRGFRILHVHWVYPFALTWVRSPGLRRIVSCWAAIVLRAAGVLGFSIVWTVHNVVPHEPVFHDDPAARRVLARRCRAVIAHTDEVAATVRRWGVEQVIVVPPGVRAPTAATRARRADARAELDVAPDAFRVLFFGLVRPYKGVDLLLRALVRCGADGDAPRPIEAAIVGECADPGLRADLLSLAGDVPPPVRVQIRFEFVSDAELAQHVAAADVAAFPFRTVTSSSSVDHALAAGLPVIVPSLATLDHLPSDAAIRYDVTGGSESLARALSGAAAMDGATRARAIESATRYAGVRSWPAAAAATWRIFDRITPARSASVPVQRSTVAS